MATPITDRPAPEPDHASTAGTVTTTKSQAPDRPRFSPAAQVAIALLRVAVGFIFLWAFLDKFFGLGYATAADKGWIDGGSPTKGFLSGVKVGPFDLQLDRRHLVGQHAVHAGPVCHRYRADPGRRDEDHHVRTPGCVDPELVPSASRAHPSLSNR